MKNKNILLNGEWEKVNECCKEKYFIDNNPNSLQYRQILRKLTDEESKTIPVGCFIRTMVDVIGVGEITYRNKKTNEKVTIPYFYI